MRRSGKPVRTKVSIALSRLFGAVVRRSEAEQALKDLGIAYEKADGIITVKGDLDISAKGLTELPDLSKVVVTGSFSCNHNRLTSLKNAPASIGGDFYCFNNELTSLDGAPRVVPGHFRCDGNQLGSLQGGPETVKGNFICNHNRLTSLKGGPSRVDRSYNCGNNDLMTLDGAPAAMRGRFFCKNNRGLISLAHAPKTFDSLTSDMGAYSSWDKVPAHFGGPLEDGRMAAPQPQEPPDDSWTSDATVLNAPMSIRKPLSIGR